MTYYTDSHGRKHNVPDDSAQKAMLIELSQLNRAVRVLPDLVVRTIDVAMATQGIDWVQTTQVQELSSMVDVLILKLNTLRLGDE